MSQASGQPRDLLMVFTRCPQVGRAKTRMIPRLGRRGAAELHRRMASHTLAWARQVRHSGVAVEVHYAGGSATHLQECFGDDLAYRPQSDGDLGARLRRAFDHALQQYDRVLVVGTDCPSLNAAALHEALRQLDHHDAVIGPSRDGGYYLLGLKKTEPSLFTHIDWGTSSVYAATQKRLSDIGFSTVELSPRADVDTPSDLAHWHREAPADPLDPSVATPQLSLIIPTLDDDDLLESSLDSLSPLDPIWVIVVDGAHDLSTESLVRERGFQYLTSPPGRAIQQNLGAAHAVGDYFVFLHADTRLPAEFDLHAKRMLDRPGVALGAFELRIDGSRRATKMIARSANLRARCLALPYGDQALCLRKQTFEKLGGFSEWPLMEDYDLVRRARRYGQIRIARPAVTTSARRYHRVGPLKATLINQAIVAAYHCGVSPERLAKWYGRE